MGLVVRVVPPGPYVGHGGTDGGTDPLPQGRLNCPTGNQAHVRYWTRSHLRN